LILGGGFGGVYTARHLEKLCKHRPDIQIVVVSRDNFLLMTPLLFEACSGTLELSHCSFPIRAFLRTTRFCEATVQNIDLDRRTVRLSAPGQDSELTYGQLVLALGAETNQMMISGSENALTFKTLADAVLLRNHVIEQFERADVETSPERKRRLLTFVIIGGGFVGIELFGELTAFVDDITPFYRHVHRAEVRFILLEARERIMPEIDAKLADYASQLLARRPGSEIRTGALVSAIEPGKVQLPSETIDAETIIVSAGIVANPVVARLPVNKDKHGHIVVDATLRCPSHPEVWGLGDCASIPGPDGKPYPKLAQHALREAKVLAHNIYGVLTGCQNPRPFIYNNIGMMGSIGHSRGFGQIIKVRLYGFLAWFVRRTYYLLQMPGWSRRFRIMADWTFAFLFRPDIVKIDLKSESASLRNPPAPDSFGPRERTNPTMAANRREARPLGGHG
jgi:NADH dehydrogenase